MLTLTQALQALAAADLDALTRAERDIDAALARFDGRPIRVCFTADTAMRKALATLGDRYRAAGWIVEPGEPSTDPRDESVIAVMFSAPPSSGAPRRCGECGAIEGDGTPGCLESYPPCHEYTVRP